MSALPPDGGEPADLSALSDTDALLDRLGGRRPSEADLQDDVSAALAGFVASIDQERDVDERIARLIEVLGGRPLFLLDPDASLESTPKDQPIELDETGSRVIDLTDAANARRAAAGRAHSAQNEAPDTIPITLPAAGLRAGQSGNGVVRAFPIQPAGGSSVAASTGTEGGAGEPVAAEALGAAVLPLQRRGWERALHQVSMPAAAAAVLLLLLLGGGVSAVVTGDPMAPVNGVTRIVSQLPGVDGSQTSLTRARREFVAAQDATTRDPAAARSHLAAARRELADVPAAEKSGLTTAIAKLSSTLASSPAPTSGGGIISASGGSSGGSTTPATIADSPVTSPPVEQTATPTVPVNTPTPTPTTEPPTETPTSTPDPTASETPTETPTDATPSPSETPTDVLP